VDYALTAVNSRFSTFTRKLVGTRVGPDSRNKRDIAWLTLLLLLCHTGAHLHGILHPAFRNLDVAGIVYNARLLLAGRLPYVDSIEIKPPGAFILFAPWLAMGGMRGVWIFSVFWAAATSLAAGWLGGCCWGKRWQSWIALLHAGGAVIAAEGDINYSFWMTLPLTLSAGCVAHAIVTQRKLPFASYWLGAGALVTLAVLIRPSAASLLLLFAIAALIEARRRQWSRIGVLMSAALVGSLLVTLFIGLPFMQHGNLDAVLSGYASVRRYATDSVTSIVAGAGGRWPATFNGLQCLPEQLPLGHVLLSLAIVPLGRFSRTEDRRELAYVAWIFGASALVGITLTLRFFAHDNAPLWAAYAILVMRPSSIVGRFIDTLSQWPGRAPLAALLIGAVTTLSSLQRLIWQTRFMQSNDDRVADLCARIEPHLGLHDSVLAWGWSAWGVYEHCHRWAPGPVFKDLTNVTTVNTNTCNRGYEPMRFRDGPLATRYLSDLERGRPALIVISDYYKSMGGDPLDEWHDARIFIREHYVVIETNGEFRALLRSDLAPQLGLPAENGLPFTSRGEPIVMNACGAADEFWQSVLDPGKSESVAPERLSMLRLPRKAKRVDANARAAAPRQLAASTKRNGAH
jgi:hypothetical protein